MDNSFATKMTFINRFLVFLCITVMGVSLFSCSKDDEDNGSTPDELTNEIGNLPGLGSAGGTPQGAAFNLPQGITIVGDITGDLRDDVDIRIGSGLLVSVYVGLRNDTDKEITINLPAGLILVSTTDQYQNGVLLVDQTVVIPANKLVHIILYTYCGNNNRAASGPSAVYTFGPITNSKLIARLVDDLKGKKINATDYMVDGEFTDDYYEIMTQAQTLLWIITDGEETDWETFEYLYESFLDQLPNK